ncbi:MAG: CopG family ribbon-helix-helix protein [Nitrososphaeraceae archaeon]|jgi:CopG family transcriptional regulator, nickel-responsive regulator|nr:CopG family ribbon-helix-helix protein [Nitrososphaeraceae archaeon]
MLPIVSISLNDDIINDINKLQKDLGFSGRSEIVRAGLRSILAEQKQRESLHGELSALLLIIHQERDDDQVTNMRHDYEEIITTHLHSKIDIDRCVEVFLLKGDAELIRNMTKNFQTNKKLDHVKLITM